MHIRMYSMFRTVLSVQCVATGDLASAICGCVSLHTFRI